MTDHYTGFRAGVVTVGSPSDDVNPFLNASHYTGNAQEFVVAQIDDLMGIVNGSLERLGTTIGDLVLWEPADWESYDVPYAMISVKSVLLIYLRHQVRLGLVRSMFHLFRISILVLSVWRFQIHQGLFRCNPQM
jgi:hypothetical protein